MSKALRATWVLIPISVALLAGAFLVSPGLFNIDELVVLAGAQAFLSTGHFAVENGLSEFSSRALNLWILVPGPNGLTPQYPVGPSVVGAPLLAAFGARGLILINVTAAIATLFALWELARRHFGGRAVALVSVLLLLGATFWLEYAFAVWPHAVGVFAVVAALLLVLDCLDDGPRSASKTLLAGGVIGLGFLFRTDTVLVLPVVGLVAFLYASRPFRLLTLLALGLLPFAALASAANRVKFGTLNPLSYGPTAGGGTALSAHFLPMAALGLAALLVVGFRFIKWRPGRREYLVAAAVGVVVLLASAAASAFAQRYIFGAWALLVDATVIQDNRPGMQALPGGTLSFWGLWKKALGQSMPWLGLLFLTAHMPADAQFRRSRMIVLILAAVWSLPFFIKAWHGGMGSNMRYLLPTIPFLCALSARLLIDFARPIAEAPRYLLSGAVAGVAVIALWTAFHPTHGGGAQQILSTWILAIVTGLALLSGVRWAGQGPVRIVGLGAIGAGLAVSTIFLLSDLTRGQKTRAFAETVSVATADLPDHALVFAPSRFISRWAFQPGHIAALPSNQDGSLDQALIDQALAKGYRVLIWPMYANDDLRERYGPRLAPSGLNAPQGEFLEVKPATSPPSGA